MEYKNKSYKDIQTYCNNFLRWILENKKKNLSIFNFDELFLEYTKIHLINKKEINKEIEEIIKKSDFYTDFLDTLYSIFCFTFELFQYCQIDINDFTIIDDALSNICISNFNKLDSKCIYNTTLNIDNNDVKSADIFSKNYRKISSIFYNKIWIKVFVSEFIIKLLNEESININSNQKKNIHSAFLDITINSQFSNDKNKKYIILNHRILIDNIFGKDNKEKYHKLKEYIISFSNSEKLSEKEFEETNKNLLNELEQIDIELLVEIFNLPMHYYHFPTNEDEKQLFLNNKLFKNIFFKNCFFESPALFWTDILIQEFSLSENFKNKIKEWIFLLINNINTEEFFG
jgi:hypothetical protein